MPQDYCMSFCFHLHAVCWVKTGFFSSMVLPSKVSKTRGHGLTGCPRVSGWRTTEAACCFRKQHLMKDLMWGPVDMRRGKQLCFLRLRRLLFHLSTGDETILYFPLENKTGFLGWRVALIYMPFLVIRWLSGLLLCSQRFLNSLSCMQICFVVWWVCVSVCVCARVHVCVFLGSYSARAILLYLCNSLNLSLSLSTQIHYIRNRMLYVSLCMVECVYVCESVCEYSFIVHYICNV